MNTPGTPTLHPSLDPELFGTPPARDSRFTVRDVWAECANFPEDHPEKKAEFFHRQMNEELNVLENVTISAMIGTGLIKWQGQKKAARERAMKIIESLGMKDRVKHRPAKLSGGERQRVAL